MAKNDKYIKVELWFSDETEMQTIQTILADYRVEDVKTFDGLIEAKIPHTALEVFKKKEILMDFPMEKVSVQDINNTLAKIQSKKKKIDIVNQEWIDKLTKLPDSFNIENLLSIKDISEDEMTTLETKDKEIIATDENKNLLDNLYIVSLDGPLSTEWRNRLAENKISLNSYYDSNRKYAYMSHHSDKQSEFLNGLEIITAIEKYLPQEKLIPGLIQELSKVDTTKESTAINKEFEIILFDSSFTKLVIAIVEASGNGTILDSDKNIIRLQTDPKSNLLATLTNLPYVTSLSIYTPPELFCDVSVKTLGLDYSDTTYAFWGKSETVAIIDSGVDKNHTDLKNRIKAVLQYGRGLADDMMGHGTHVAGIICGDGTASEGKIKGIAPQSQIVSIGIIDNNGRIDLPLNLGKLFQIASDNEAKIINLSWGYKVNGAYQHTASNVDEYIYNNPEILIVVAAGNEEYDKMGNLAYKTLGTPATAKNVLTVGAATSRRTIPVINQTWGQIEPQKFPSLPYSENKLISAIDIPSINSSRGPTEYDSIKPEVLAPGNYILSARANSSTITTTNAKYYDENYVFETGTSMAAPLISGLAALIREYLRTIHNYNKPSAALIKAIIIGSSYKIDNTRKPPLDNSLAEVGFPDFDQGFGLVNVNNLLNTQTVKLYYADIYNKDDKALESRSPAGGIIKSYRDYAFEISGDNGDLSITLCWTDIPAKGIQNNLQLSLKTPSGKWEIGNGDHLYRKSSSFDTISEFNLKPHDKYNTTEKIFIQNAQVGKYIIKITAQNTINLPQGYSLAILGNVSEFKEK
jgi:serine protease AprX